MAVGYLNDYAGWGIGIYAIILGVYAYYYWTD